MTGVYQHCKEKHLHRYVAEFDFRYGNRSKLGVEDQERTRRALLAEARGSAYIINSRHEGEGGEDATPTEAKFKATVHYVIWKAGRRHTIGAIKLNKVLWFADA